MYAKCGKIDVAWRAFDEIGKLRNLCSWNSMIMGLAVHGQCSKALELYDQMLVSNLTGPVLNISNWPPLSTIIVFLLGNVFWNKLYILIFYLIYQWNTMLLVIKLILC
jgi:pentatricopeptide repeat protein